MRKTYEEYQLARREGDHWYVLNRGTKEECLKALENNDRFWYNGEVCVIFKATTIFHAELVCTGKVSYTKEEM